MGLFLPHSFDEAFLAGEIIGFIEDHSRTCRRCGRDGFYGDDISADFDDSNDYLCPRCWDERNRDDEDNDYD